MLAHSRDVLVLRDNLESVLTNPVDAATFYVIVFPRMSEYALGHATCIFFLADEDITGAGIILFGSGRDAVLGGDSKGRSGRDRGFSAGDYQLNADSAVRFTEFRRLVHS